MKFVPMKEGSPSQHLGFGHTLKHYLNPEEMWEDLADDLPAAVRPKAVVDSLGDVGTPAWQQVPPALDPALSAQWSSLRNAYRVGYMGLVADHAAEVADPSNDPEGWVRVYNRATTHLGSSGILLRLIQRSGTWHVYSAFRPNRYPHVAHWCPPRDERNVSIRRMISASWADQKMAYWREDGEPA